MNTINSIKSRAKQIFVALVCIGILLAFALYATGAYDSITNNFLSSLPAIIIIGGTIGYAIACKKDSKY